MPRRARTLDPSLQAPVCRPQPADPSLQLTRVGLALDSDGASYPIQKKKTSLEFLRSIAHLRARTNSIAAVARVRSTLAQATHP